MSLVSKRQLHCYCNSYCNHYTVFAMGTATGPAITTSNFIPIAIACFASATLTQLLLLLQLLQLPLRLPLLFVTISGFCFHFRISPLPFTCPYQELKLEFSNCLTKIRILAKFLGFLLFQPYYGVETISQTVVKETLKIRNRVSVSSHCSVRFTFTICLLMYLFFFARIWLQMLRNCKSKRAENWDFLVLARCFKTNISIPRRNKVNSWHHENTIIDKATLTIASCTLLMLVSWCDQINEISFELRIETILM